MVPSVPSVDGTVVDPAQAGDRSAANGGLVAPEDAATQTDPLQQVPAVHESTEDATTPLAPVTTDPQGSSGDGSGSSSPGGSKQPVSVPS